MGLSLLLAVAAVWFAGQENFSFSLGIATLTVATLGTLAVGWRSGDLLSPLMLSAAFYLLAYVGGALYFWHNPANPQGNIALTISHSELTDPVWLATAAWVTFIVGYLARPLRWLAGLIPKLPTAARHRSPWWVVLALLALGWPARLYQMATGRYFHTAVSEMASTSTSWLVSVGSGLPLLATAFLGAWSLRFRGSDRRSPPLWMFWALVAVETLWYAPTGERGAIVGLVLMLVVVSYYGKGVFPWRTTCVGALILVLVVFPFGEAYRGDEPGELGAADPYQLAPKQHFSQAIRRTFATTPQRAISHGVDATFSRFSDITSLGFIMAPDSPGSGRKPGETLLWSAEAFVPRVILHHKVDPGAYGNEFGRRFGLVSASNYVVSVAATQPGDLYMNFGWLGVVLLMPLVGGAYRFIADYLDARSRDPAALAIYAVISWPLVSIHENILAMGVLGVVKLMFMYCIVLAAVVTVWSPAGRPRGLGPATGA
jgi:hypothetical protein